MSAPELTLERVQLGSVLPGTPTDEAINESLQVEDAQAFHRITVQLDTTVFRLLMSAKTATELSALRKELFEQYVRLSMSATNFVRAVSSKEIFHNVCQQLFKSTAATFESASLLSGDQRTEALFSVATLHRAYALLPSIERRLRQPSAFKETDARLCGTFVGSMFWAQMHLDCLKFAIRNDLSPSAEVLEKLVGGTRASLDTYAAIREAMELRAVDGDSDEWSNSVLWDAEDQALADESTAERDSLSFLQ